MDATSGHTLTYAELDVLIRRMAAGLQALGLEPGQVVGIFAPNVPEYPIAYFGVALAGGTSTTVNGLYTERELALQLRNSGARFLFTTGAMLDRALPAAAAAGIEAVFTLDPADSDGAPSYLRMLGEAADLVEPTLDPATALVSLPYSSGTTGLAKGVMLSHRNMVANLLQMAVQLPMDDHDVIAGVLPFFHIYGQTVVMNAGLLAGATIVTLPRFDLGQFLRLIEDHRVTKAYVVPPIVVALAKHPAVEGFDSSSLEMIMCGAAPLDSAIETLCSERISTRVQQGYGLTEASPVTHCTPLSDPLNPGAIGKLLPNTQARLVDVETGRDAEPGAPGEVWVRGPQVMLGYLNDDQATAHTLDDDGWLRTGDIAVFTRGRRLEDRRPAQGADQVQRLPGAAGDAGGGASDPPGGGRCLRCAGRRRGVRRDSQGLRGVAGSGRRRRADRVRRRAGRPARAGARARVHRRDPQVAVGQAAAASAGRARAGAW